MKYETFNFFKTHCLRSFVKALFWFCFSVLYSVCFFRLLVLVGSSQGPLFFAAPLHHKPDAVLEEAQGPWARLGQTDGWPLAWVLSPLLGLALGTSALLSGPGRRRTGLPVQKSERFSSRCLASSPTRDASQRRDCPFVFKRGTVRFLKSLIYS